MPARPQWMAEVLETQERFPCKLASRIGLEDDRDVPWQQGAALANAWPGAQVVRTTGLGHRRILRDPEVIARVTAFIVAA